MWYPHPPSYCFHPPDVDCLSWVFLWPCCFCWYCWLRVGVQVSSCLSWGPKARIALGEFQVQMCYSFIERLDSVTCQHRCLALPGCADLPVYVVIISKQQRTEAEWSTQGAGILRIEVLLHPKPTPSVTSGKPCHVRASSASSLNEGTWVEMHMVLRRSQIPPSILLAPVPESYLVPKSFTQNS